MQASQVQAHARALAAGAGRAQDRWRGVVGRDALLGLADAAALRRAGGHSQRVHLCLQRRSGVTFSRVQRV